jgi:mRNA interferase MazF
MAPGELYLANFPFGAGGGMTLRPVLSLTALVGPVPEVLVAYISSVIPAPFLQSDVMLDPSTADHASTNLKTTSVLRLHKLATIHQRSVVRFLGALSTTSLAEVNARLRTLLGL